MMSEGYSLNPVLNLKSQIDLFQTFAYYSYGLNFCLEIGGTRKAPYKQDPSSNHVLNPYSLQNYYISPMTYSFESECCSLNFFLLMMKRPLFPKEAFFSFEIPIEQISCADWVGENFQWIGRIHLLWASVCLIILLRHFAR